MYESIKKALMEADGVHEEQEVIIISDSEDEVWDLEHGMEVKHHIEILTLEFGY